VLSNPLTHIRNVAGNAAALAFRPLETGASAAIEAATTLGGKARPRERFLGEAPAEVFGMAAALPNALRDAYAVLRSGLTPANIASGQVPREAFRGRLADLTVNAPGRALGAGDTLFGSLNEGASIYKQAYRQASQEGLRGGQLVERVVDLIQRPTQNMLEDAASDRAYRTFQQTGKFVEKATALRDVVPGVISTPVLPFIKTPYNIGKYVLERTPFGAVKMATDRRGKGIASDRLGRMAVGTATMGYFYTLAQQGLITGAPPSTPAERDAWQRQGKQPYSILIGGEWRSYQGLQPISSLIAAAAAANDAASKGDDADAQSVLLVAGIALARSLVDSQWTQGLSDFLDLLNDPQTRDPETALENVTRFGQRQVSSLVPAIVRGIAQASDPTLRKPESTLGGFLQAITQNVPGLTQLTPAQLTAFGEERKRPTSGLQSMLDPTAPSRETTDPLEVELKRLQKAGYDVQPGLVSERVTAFKTPVVLEPAQHRLYQRVSGMIARELLEGFLSSEAWAQLPDADKERIINKTIDEVRTQTRKALEPSLQEQAVDVRLKQARRRIEQGQALEEAVTGG
jgi:hypothetical protein